MLGCLAPPEGRARHARCKGLIERHVEQRIQQGEQAHQECGMADCATRSEKRTRTSESVTNSLGLLLANSGRAASAAQWWILSSSRIAGDRIDGVSLRAALEKRRPNLRESLRDKHTGATAHNLQILLE